MFVCLAVFAPIMKFHLYGDATINSEGLQFFYLYFALMHGTSCETGHPFVTVIAEEP